MTAILPQLAVRRGRDAVEFYKAALGAVEAGATEVAPVDEEHGWRMGRIADPFGHHWEVGRPRGDWPPG